MQEGRSDSSSSIHGYLSPWQACGGGPSQKLLSLYTSTAGWSQLGCAADMSQDIGKSLATPGLDLAQGAQQQHSHLRPPMAPHKLTWAVQNADSGGRTPGFVQLIT